MGKKDKIQKKDNKSIKKDTTIITTLYFIVAGVVIVFSILTSPFFFFVDFAGVTFVATALLLRFVFIFVTSELDDVVLSTLKASFFATFDT